MVCREILRRVLFIFPRKHQHCSPFFPKLMKLLSSRIGSHADMDKFRKAFLVVGTLRSGAMLSVDYGSSLRVSITHRGPDEYLLEIHRRLKSAEEHAMIGK